LEANDRSRILSWIQSKEIRQAIKLNNAKAIAGALTKLDNTITAAQGSDYIYRRLVNDGNIDRCAIAVLRLLRDRRDVVLPCLDEQNSEHLERLIAQCLESGKKRRDERAAGSSRTYADIIFGNWKNTYSRAPDALATGIYQIFRRYKPESHPDKPLIGNPSVGSHDLSNLEGQAVICELISITWESMECILITAEQNVYFGTLSINYENILYGILQRRIPDSESVNQRVIVMRLEQNGLPWYSGLCIKTGDTTHRPLAAECLYVPVPSDHSKLYDEFDSIKAAGWEAIRVPDNSEIVQYLTDVPPRSTYSRHDLRWKRVKFVRDFPTIRQLSKRNEQGIIYFREPLRALDAETITRLSRRLPRLEVFRQDHKTQRKSRRRPKRLSGD
jgi:hypothetical protein